MKEKDKWRVVITMELECIRATGDAKVPSQIPTTQTTRWGAVADSPAAAFREATEEGFTSYTENLPDEQIVREN